MQPGQIGEGIQNLRKRAGLTQSALGDALGVSRQAVSKWESGAALPSIDNIVELARALNVSVDELLLLERGERGERAELSAEGVGRLLDEHTRRQDKRMKRLLWCLVGAAAALTIGVIVSAWLSASRSGQLESRMDERLSGVDARIGGIASSIDAQIARSIDDALASESTFLADGGCRKKDYDFETDELTLLLFAYPRETQTGETAEFAAACSNGKRYAISCEQTESGAYEAELRVPAEDAEEITLYVSLRLAGAVRTEQLDTLYHPLDSLRSILDVYADVISDADGVRITPYVTVRPAYDEYGNPLSRPVSGRVEVYVKDQLTRELPLNIEEGTYPESDGIVEWATHTAEEIDLGGVSPEDVRLTAFVTDNLGHEYRREAPLIPGK